jgi:hypothetical protein
VPTSFTPVRGSSRLRLRYAGLTAATVALGLGVHLGGEALPPGARDLAGDALWAAMIYWIAGGLAPTAARSWRAAGAAALSAAVEGSQLLRPPWLVELRATRLGHLVLGSDFDARDLVAYAAGIAGAALLDWVVSGDGDGERDGERDGA